MSLLERLITQRDIVELEPVIFGRMIVLPGTGNPIGFEPECAIVKLDRDQIVSNLRIVEMELDRFIEFLNEDHNFTRCFELGLEYVWIHDANLNSIIRSGYR